MNSVGEAASKPLARLLEGVKSDVFGKRPRTIGLRDFQRDMSSILQKLRINQEYRILTNRGAPTFLIIPIDPDAWTSLLAAAAPETEYQLEMAHKREESGEDLPDTDAVLEQVELHPSPA